MVAETEHGGGGRLLSVVEAGAALGLGYHATLAAIHRGQVPATRVGKSYRIRAEDLVALTTPAAPGTGGRP